MSASASPGQPILSPQKCAPEAAGERRGGCLGGIEQIPRPVQGRAIPPSLLAIVGRYHRVLRLESIYPTQQSQQGRGFGRFLNSASSSRGRVKVSGVSNSSDRIRVRIPRPSQGAYRRPQAYASFRQSAIKQFQHRGCATCLGCSCNDCQDWMCYHRSCTFLVEARHESWWGCSCNDYQDWMCCRSNCTVQPEAIRVF